MHGQEVLNAHRDYRESRLLSAQPIEIVEMLYDVAVRSLEAAIGFLKSGDALARSAEVSRAQEAINELALVLDHSAGASFSKTLAELYGYTQDQILKGHVQKSEQAFRNALSVLRPLLEGWMGVSKLEARKRQASATQIEMAEEQMPQITPVLVNDQRAAYQQDADLVSRDWSG